MQISNQASDFRYNMGVRLLPYINGGYSLVIFLGLVGGWAGHNWPFVLGIMISQTAINLFLGLRVNGLMNETMLVSTYNLINIVSNSTIVIITGGYPTSFWITFLAGIISSGIFMSKSGILLNGLFAACSLIFPHLFSGLSVQTLIGILMQTSMLVVTGIVSYLTAALSLREHEKHVKAEEELLQVNSRLSQSLGKIAQQSEGLTLLTEMSDMLQSCNALTDVFPVISQYARQLFPLTNGALFLYSPLENEMGITAPWGNYQSRDGKEVLAPDDCWALRRGHVHRVDDTNPGVSCRHFDYAPGKKSLCIPMLAQGEMIGVFHIETVLDQVEHKEGRTPDLNTLSSLAETTSKQIALSLANLRLRETLREQSIRDSLTGLFNRRYMEETLEREVLRARREKLSLGVVMMDIDHFKDFNDTHGHDAGDLILKEIGKVIRMHFRGGDIACRYGGEEFVFILPGSKIQTTRQRAEELHQAIKSLTVMFRGQSLGGITVSMGVASYPENGLCVSDLIKSADSGLYTAKANGRDRVEVVEVPNSPA